METGPRFKVSERLKKRGIELAIPGLVVQQVIHYNAESPRPVLTKLHFERGFQAKLSREKENVEFRFSKRSHREKKFSWMASKV